MVIYEVNLAVDRDVIDEFTAWLRPHIEAILTLEGFVRATMLEREHDGGAAARPDRALLTVHYYLRDRAALETYFERHAAALREDGIRRFPDRFTADRRILHEQEAFTAS